MRTPAGWLLEASGICPCLSSGLCDLVQLGIALLEDRAHTSVYSVIMCVWQHAHVSNKNDNLSFFSRMKKRRAYSRHLRSDRTQNALENEPGH